MVEGKKGVLKEQEGAWNEYANVVFRTFSNSCYCAFSYTYVY